MLSTRKDSKPLKHGKMDLNWSDDMFTPKAHKIDDTTYRITEYDRGHAINMYLLTGGEHALLIDTGLNLTNVPKAIRRITDLPLWVCNTHGHSEQILGNHWYPEVFFPEEDEDVFRKYMQENPSERNSPSGRFGNLIGAVYNPLQDLIRYNRPSEHEELPEDGFFDLGGRIVGILKTPGHTHGSVSYLDEASGRLFCGDLVGEKEILVDFEESSPLDVYETTVSLLLGLVEDGKISQLYPSHGNSPLSADILRTAQEVSSMVLKGDYKDSMKITYQGIEFRFRLTGND